MNKHILPILGLVATTVAIGIWTARPSMSTQRSVEAPNCCTPALLQDEAPVICAIQLKPDSRVKLTFVETDVILRNGVTYKAQFGSIDQDNQYTPPAKHPGYDLDFVFVTDTNGVTALIPFYLSGYPESGRSEWARNATPLATYQRGRIPANAYINTGTDRLVSQNVALLSDNALLRLCGVGQTNNPKNPLIFPACKEGQIREASGPWVITSSTLGVTVDCGSRSFEVSAEIAAMLKKMFGISVQAGASLESRVSKTQTKLEASRHVYVYKCVKEKWKLIGIKVCTRPGVQWSYDPEWGAFFLGNVTSNPTPPVWSEQVCVKG